MRKPGPDLLSLRTRASSVSDSGPSSRGSVEGRRSSTNTNKASARQKDSSETAVNRATSVPVGPNEPSLQAKFDSDTDKSNTANLSAGTHHTTTDRLPAADSNVAPQSSLLPSPLRPPPPSSLVSALALSQGAAQSGVAPGPPSRPDRPNLFSIKHSERPVPPDPPTLELQKVRSPGLTPCPVRDTVPGPTKDLEQSSANNLSSTSNELGSFLKNVGSASPSRIFPSKVSQSSRASQVSVHVAAKSLPRAQEVSSVQSGSGVASGSTAALL